METNIGLPSEILFLCTSTETKERALALFEQIRRNIHTKAEIAANPALPAICSLIASEQLGNTVVSERRAQQWSQSTPQDFKALKAEIQKILFSLDNSDGNNRSDVLLQNLVHQFNLETMYLEYMIQVRKAFNTALPEKWRVQPRTVQISIFMWICRRFKLHTKQPIDDLPNGYDVPLPEVDEIHNVLDKRWPANLDIANLPISGERSSTRFLPIDASNNYSNYRDHTFSPLDPTDFSRLVNDFELDNSIADGLQHLQKVIRQTELLKNLVDWDSTLGRCTIFYWTCSVLKITGIKHITLRTHHNVNKKDFDKLILALDGHRGDLRRSLEEFYTINVHLTDPFKSTQVDSFDRTSGEMSIGYIDHSSTRRSGKRGRPRKDKSPASPTTPLSDVELKMTEICDHRTYKRALLLYRSIMARSLPSLERISSEAFPFLFVHMANEQLQNNQLTEKEIMKMSALRKEEFVSALTVLRSLTKNCENVGSLIAQTKFDDMALEHGLCINSVVAMIETGKYLKESKCLSERMNWESPLVTCTILFWTSAILQVPDINMNALRKDSQASKREFDTMLQLLNNHCTHIRHRMELDLTKGYLVSTRNVYTQKGSNVHTPHSESHFSQDDGPDERPKKVLKSEDKTFFDNNWGSTHTHLSFDETIARRYLDTVVSKTKEDPNIPGSSKATISDVETLSGGKHNTPAEGGTDLTKSLTTNRHSGSDISCAVANTTLGEGGVARNTRYSTKDYADIINRIDAWVPHGQDVLERQSQYRIWEGKMVEKYGSAWERNITRYKDPGRAFE